MQYSPIWIVFPPHLSAPSVRSLSLLFILEEILSQLKQIDLVEEMNQDRKVETSQIKSKNDSSDCLRINLLEKIFALEDPFFQRNIPPDKLCFYSHILLQTSQVDGQNVLNILDELRISHLQCRSEILRPKIGKEIVWEKVLEFVKVWRKKLSSLFSAFIPLLHEARTDENVLLFLLEKKDLFNLYFGEKTIEYLLGKFFPYGEDYWHAVLHEGFQRRNFSHFFESKKHLLQSTTLVKK
jgi:hypothetical protein